MSCTEALQPDPAVLDGLYREHGAALRRLCRTRLGNDQDAEDASHEALLRAWSAMDRFDPTRPMWPWLATIAANVCTDIQRRARTAELRELPTEPTPMLPEEVALNADHTGLVREALGHLPGSAQKVLFLRDVEGWSYGRIGRHEGRTAPAVRTAVTRARHRLRVQVEAAARASGRWPLPALGLLLARGRRRVRRARSDAADLAVRSVNLIDASTGLATSWGTTAAVHAVVGAVLMVGAAHTSSPPPTPRLADVQVVAWRADPFPEGAAQSWRPASPTTSPAGQLPVETVSLPPVAVPSVPDVPAAPQLDPVGVVPLAPPEVADVVPDVSEVPLVAVPAQATTSPGADLDLKTSA